MFWIRLNNISDSFKVNLFYFPGLETAVVGKLNMQHGTLGENAGVKISLSNAGKGKKT